MNRIVLAFLALLSCAALSAQSACEIAGLYEALPIEDVDADGISDDVDSWLGTVFTGLVSSDWFDAGNWDNGLPALGNDANIPAGLEAVVSGSLMVDFLVDNDGDIIILYTGTINTDIIGVINNSGEISNINGTLANSGYISNIGEIENNGTFTNHGTIYNEPTTTIGPNLATGFIYNYLTFINNGTLNNAGYIDNTYGTLTNNGTLTNSGNLYNDDEATIGNTGVINNDGDFYNYGDFWNWGTLNGNPIWE